MKSRILVVIIMMLMAGVALCQTQSQQTSQEPVVKIGTDLIQIDAVVLDKSGSIVRGLTQDDFELYENGKRQHINFFEFVDAGKGLRIAREAGPEAESGKNPPISNQGLGDADVRRVFAFVVDDLTIKPSDMTYVQRMLTHFVESEMQPSDLVGIIRSVGGSQLLQQFTSDPDVLYRAIALLQPSTSPLNAFGQVGSSLLTGGSPSQLSSEGISFVSPSETVGGPVDIDSPNDESNVVVRAYMTLGTASFVVDSMKLLPGRKSMVLISGGIQALGPGGSAPIVNGQDTGADPRSIGLPSVPEALSPADGGVNQMLDRLADKATRAGVAINTLDLRGLSGQAGVPSFDDTPGISGLGGTNSLGFGRVADESMVGGRNPYDVTAAHMGLRELSAATGGIAVLNRNQIDRALGQIVNASDGYYLLAYAPSDANFKGDFRKWEIKVKGGYKVLSRKGYFAKVEEQPAAPKTMEEQMLQAIQSPVVKRQVGLDMMVLYKATQGKKGAVEVDLNIDPAALTFQDTDGKKKANLDVAAFVYDQFGRMRGGFSKTLNLALTPRELERAYKDGVPFPSQNAELSPGSYEIRIGVRDKNSGALGTVSRYVEVPNLEKGHLSASTLLLGSVDAGDTRTQSAPVSGNRRISRNKDLRYAVIIYNAARKDGHTKVKTQLTIMQDGRILYREPPQAVIDAGKNQPLIKVGQVILSNATLGRYVIQLEITDEFAAKNDRTIHRSMDFAVVR
ncbi:MAG: VWA domain-containing protein [Blastocatellia bacterium]